MAGMAASGKLDADRMRRLETLAPTLDKLIDEGNACLAEYRAEGDVSDREAVEDWVGRAEAHGWLDLIR
jgi:hypothetical protein